MKEREGGADQFNKLREKRCTVFCFLSFRAEKNKERGEEEKEKEKSKERRINSTYNRKMPRPLQLPSLSHPLLSPSSPSLYLLQF